MSALQPFDKHPADPSTLRSTSTSLAAEAEAAAGLGTRTQRAYAGVPANWHGVGQAEARRSARVVVAEATQVSSAVAGAAVALGAWAGKVEAFNAEVDRIVQRVESAAAGWAMGGVPDEAVRAERDRARRQGESDWHAAYDEHIVAGGTQVAHLVKRGPTEDEILRLFQAGLLPMSVVNLYPAIDFGRTDWRALFANLRAQGIDPLSWATLGTYRPDELKVRLDLLRRIGVPPPEYKNLLQLYWVSVAAGKAGIDLSHWDPNRGADALKDIILKVYTYYGNLFLQHPYLQWAGMANMVGPSFAAGFFDLALFRRMAQALEHQPGLPVDVSGLAAASDEELKFFETTFLRMQKDIFYDQAMMHEAYLAGGLDAIHELQAAGLVDPRTEQAWGSIDLGRRTGDQDLVKTGNTMLLYREQHDIIDQNYQKMYDRPVVGPAFTYLMTAVGEPSIPGARDFNDYKPLVITIETPGPDKIPFTPWDNPLQGEIKVRTPLPDGNIAHFEDRWDYITNDTLPAYQNLLADHPDQAQQIVASDVGDRIDRYRIYHRIDDLLWKFGTDWGISFQE